MVLHGFHTNTHVEQLSNLFFFSNGNAIKGATHFDFERNAIQRKKFYF